MKSRRSPLLRAIATAALALAGLSATAQAGVRVKLVPAGAAGETLPDSFDRLREIVESASKTGELRIRLPFGSGGGSAGSFEGFDLPDVAVTFDAARKAFALSGKIAGADVALAGAFGDGRGTGHYLLGFRPSAFALRDRIQSVRGTPLESLDFGGRTFTLADAAWPSLDALGEARGWFGAIAPPSRAGWSFDGKLPYGSLPPALRQSLGLPDSGEVALSGSVDAGLDLFAGGGEIRSLALAATVEAQLGGTSRRFRLELAAGTATAPSIAAEMVDPWKAAFGLPWLVLDGARISAGAAGAVLTGRCDVAGRKGEFTAELAGKTLKKLSARVDSLPLDDLVRAGVADGLPAEAIAPVQRLVDGAALALSDLEIVLDPSARTITVAAKVSLRGVESEFLYAARIPTWDGTGSSGAGDAQSAAGRKSSLFGFRPAHLNLGRIFPQLLSVPSLADIAAADLELPAFFGGQGDAWPALPDLPGSWRGILGRPSTEKTDAASSTSSGGGFHLPSGLNFSARLPALSLPRTGSSGRLLALLEKLGGRKIDGLDLTGTFGRELKDLHLSGRLPALLPRAELPWLKGGDLALSIAGEGNLSLEGEVTVDSGSGPLVFRVSSAIDAKGASVEGVLQGTWRHPHGIEWLELEDVRLRLSLEGEKLAAACSAMIPVGKRRGEVSLELGPKTSGTNGTKAKLAVRLDRATIGDLARLAAPKAAADRLELSGLDSAIELFALSIALELDVAPRVVASGKAALLGKTADLILVLEPRGGDAQAFAVATRVPELRLGDLVPKFRGTAGDIALPAPVLSFGQGFGDGVASLSLPEVKAWNGGADLQLSKSLHLACKLPLASLPPQARRGLGLPDTGDLELEGTIDAGLGLLSGKAEVRALSLRAKLPAGTLAQRLPGWMKEVQGGERSFAIEYAAPSTTSFGVTQEVTAEIAGATRRFRLGGSGGTHSDTELRAEMIEPWKSALGLRWLDLSSASLTGTASGATLEGRFDLAGHAATAALAIAADGATSLTVGVEKIGLGELSACGAIDALPDALEGPLKGVLDGGALELRSASMTLEPGPRRLTLAAQVDLRGTESDFLYITTFSGWPEGFGGLGIGGGGGRSKENEKDAASAGGRRGSFLALRPIHLSLGKLFPRALQIEGLKDIASIDLDLPTMFGGGGDLSLDLPDLPSGWRARFSEITLPALPSVPGLPSWSGGPSAGGKDAGGSGGFRLGQLEIPAGLNLNARLPALRLPKTGPFAGSWKLAERLVGFSIDGIDLHGNIGLRLEDLRLSGALPPFQPNVKLPWLKGGQLGLSISGEGSIAFQGRIATVLRGEPLEFTIDSTASRSAAAGTQLAIAAALDGTWKRPLGIEGLELRDVRLELAPSTGGDGGVAAKCAASFPIGSSTARVEIALEGRASASIVARLDRVTLADLAALATKSGGGGILEKIGLDGAIELHDVGIELSKSGPATRIVAAGSAKVAGKDADLLVTLEPRGAAVAVAVALRLPDVELGRIVPAIAGTAGDLRFPATRLTFADGWGDGAYVLQAGSSALDLARFARADGALEFAKGLRFAGEMPVAGLPPAAREALGLEASGPDIRFEGSIDTSLALLSGKTAVKELELRAVLPASAPGRGLPAWMTPVESGPREVVLAYAPARGVSFQSARQVDVALGGERRRFELRLEARSGAGATSATFEAALADPWHGAFGLPWLHLEKARIAGAIGTGSASSKATLEAQVDLAGRAATLTAELSPGAGTSVAGKLVVRVDRLALSDLARLGIVERLPLDALTAGGAGAPEVRDLAITVELGAERSLTFSGRTSFRGMEADVLLAVSKRAGSAAAPLLVVKPDRFSLGRIAPGLLQNEATHDLASREMNGLFVLAGPNTRSLAAADLPAGFAGFLPASAGGGGAAETPLTPGINVLSSLDLDALPRDGVLGQALAQLRSALGVSGSGLSLRGTIGRSLADLDLSADFPPIEPRNAPPWLKSGQLSLVVTGRPSLAVEGRVVVAVDGELLTFLLAAKIEREGAASPAIKLRGALESDRPWTSPFGIEWLELDRVGLGIALDATGSVTPSFSGRMKIGAKDLEVAAKLRVNASGVPIGGMFLGASEAGFALHDLTQLQGRIASAATGGRVPASIPLRPGALLPDVALRGVELKLAPRDEPDEHVKRGLAIRGQLFVPTKPLGPATRALASVDVEVDREGVRAEGQLATQHLGPITLDEATVSLVAARDDQHLRLRGGADFLGSRQALDIELSREQISLDAQAAIGKRWKSAVHLQAPFDLDSPKFLADGALPDDLLGALKSEAQSQVGSIAQAFDAGVEGARGALEEAGQRREQRQKAIADLKGRLEKEFATAKADLDRAQQDALLAKQFRDGAEERWRATPDSQPVLKSARRKAFEVAQAAYEVGSSGKKAIYEKKKALFAALKAPAEAPAVLQAQAELAGIQTEIQEKKRRFEKLRDAQLPIVEFRKRNPGKALFELHRGAFKLDVATLARGGDLPVDFQVRWLDRTVEVKGTLSPDDLVATAREILSQFFPKLS